MKNILFLGHDQPLEGGRIGNEIAALSEAGHHIEFLAWNRNPSIDSEQTKWRNTPIHLIHHSAPFTSPKIIFHLKFAYRLFLQRADRMEISFDAIHCTHYIFLPLSFRLARKYSAKVVYDAYEIHSLDFSQYFPFGKRFAEILFKLIENRFATKANLILTVDTAKDAIEQRYRQINLNVEVLNNFPDLSFPSNPEKEKNLKKIYEERKIIVYIGGIEERKGLLVSLDALQKVRLENPEVKLLLIGSFGKEIVEAEKQILRLNLQEHVEFINWLPYDEMFLYLKTAKIGMALYQPDLHNLACGKGGGRKCFDYMKAGLPVIAPEFGEIGASVKDEKCGILVDTTNPEQIARTMTYLLQHPDEAQTMGLKGRKAVEEKYNWNIEKQKLLKAYERLLSNGS
jgi:glycosyltransferase involved in cell wall biosynthesis